MLVLLITVRTHLCHFRIHAGRPSVVIIVGASYISSFIIIIIISTITLHVLLDAETRGTSKELSTPPSTLDLCVYWLCFLFYFASFSVVWIIFSSGLHMCRPCLVTTKKKPGEQHPHPPTKNVSQCHKQSLIIVS